MLITIPAVQGCPEVLVLRLCKGEKGREWEDERQRDGNKISEMCGLCGCKWMNVCGWGGKMVVEVGSCEITPASVSLFPPPRPQWVYSNKKTLCTQTPRSLPSLQHFTPPPSCLSFFFFQVCCTRGGKDRIYHLSAFGSPELRDAGQHKIIIHRHEITKPPGDPTTKFFLYSPQPPTPLKRMEHVWRRGEGVTVERSGSGGVGGRGDSIS